MDYKTLITSEHQGQPKFMAWLNAALGMIQDVQNLLASLPVEYDIDFAAGRQLDTLGLYLNLSRELAFQPSGKVSPVMNDEIYRLALKAKISQSHYDGTIPGMYDMFQEVFGSTKLHFSVIDNQNMSMSAVVYGATDSLTKDLINHGLIIPKPEGVSANIQATENKVFAWGMSSDIYGGWGDGYWLI